MEVDRNLAQMLRSVPRIARLRACNFHVHKALGGCFLTVLSARS